MWCQAGFQPDSFWDQTPATFAACMQGVRERLEAEAEGETRVAWQTANFMSAAQAGKLKPLRHYTNAPKRKMSAREMLANMRILAQRVNRKFEGTE
jgi:hypothetical protein